MVSSVKLDWRDKWDVSNWPGGLGFGFSFGLGGCVAVIVGVVLFMPDVCTGAAKQHLLT